MRVVRHERGRRAAREGVLDEVGAAADGHEQVAFAMRRESICTPVTTSAHGRAISRPSARARRPRPGSREHLARDSAVVERDAVIGELHLGVGALAGDHDDVARARVGQGRLDRLPAVEHDLELARRRPPPRSRPGPRSAGCRW